MTRQAGDFLIDALSGKEAEVAERRSKLLAAMSNDPSLVDEWLRKLSGSPSETSPPAPKRRWVFVHDNDPVVIDEQEVRGSCFFRDYVMGKLECRRLDPNATATESNDDLTTTIDRMRELRDRKSARIAEINQKPGDLALEWVRLRLETEVRFCNDQIVRLSRGLPIDQEPHEIAKQALAREVGKW